MFKNLNAELARKGINVNILANFLGVTPKTIRNKLCGKTEFTLSELQKISKIFPECSMDYLFEIRGDAEAV